MNDKTKMTAEQEAVFRSAMTFARNKNTGKPWVLHGLAGTGKTYTLARIARALLDQGRTVHIVAFTGKAASVLSRKTGLTATTIHNVLYTPFDNVDEEGNKKLSFSPKRGAGSLTGTIILVDEASMVGSMIAEDLAETGATILACGDPGQLPPVRDNSIYNKPTAILKQIHRQAMDSGIIRQAHGVRNGSDYQRDEPDVFVQRGVKFEQVTSMDIFLCGQNATRKRMTHKLRHWRGLGDKHPQPGEPVMCLRNNHGLGLYNGAIYTLSRPYQPRDNEIWLDVDGREVRDQLVSFEGLDDDGWQHQGLEPDECAPITGYTYGYACTVHKAQGSEWDNVFLVDDWSRRDTRTAWLYTGMTRAAKTLVIQAP